MFRQVPHPRKVWLHPKVRREDEKKFEIRRSVEFSSATRRCIPWRVDGHSHGETCRHKRGIMDVDFSEFDEGVFKKRQSWRNLMLAKKARGKPNVSSKSDHPGSPKAERIQWYPVNETPRKNQKLERKEWSRSTGRSTDEKTMTLWMIWMWMWLLVHISECHSSSSSSS